MKMKFNKTATASVLAGVALTFAGCSTILPGYFESKKAKEIRLEINNTSGQALELYRDRTPSSFKNVLESEAACDSNYSSLKNTGDLCFGAYGKRLISEASSGFAEAVRDENSPFWGLQKIEWGSSSHFTYRRLRIASKLDKLNELKTETDSLSQVMSEKKVGGLLPLFSKLQKLQSDFLAEFYALQELQMKSNADTTSLTRLENAVSAFCYSMDKNKIVYDSSGIHNRGTTPIFSKWLEQDRSICLMSSYMFIQFGKEIGLDLVGVNLGAPASGGSGHFLVAYRENGIITHYIETTALMHFEHYYLGPPPASQRSSLIGQYGYLARKYNGWMETAQKSLQLLENGSDLKDTAIFIRDSLQDTRTWSYIRDYGVQYLDYIKFLVKGDIADFKEQVEDDMKILANVALHGDSYGSIPLAISTAEKWEAANKKEWKSITYIEAADLK